MAKAGELREHNVFVSMERTLFEALQKEAGRKEVSASSYLRVLLLDDLMHRGVLTTTDVLRMIGANHRDPEPTSSVA